MHTLHRPSSSRRLALLLGLCAGAAVGIAHAADVDGSAAASRRLADTPALETQVKHVCPQLEAQLTEALGLAQARHRDEGTALVSFRLTGTVIDEVHQRGGPAAYRGDLRRAVRRLSCDNGGADKTYVMQVSFVDQPASTASTAGTAGTARTAGPVSLATSGVTIRTVSVR